MEMSAQCLLCTFRKQAETVAQYSDEVKKAAYLKEVARYLGSLGPDDSSPYVSAEINKLHEQYFGFTRDLSDLKRIYNERMLRMEKEIEGKILAADDPLRAALQYARAGNYIDFGAMDSVDDDKLAEILDGAQGEILDPEEYACFVRELGSAHAFLEILDNAGEIVMDKLLIRQLKRQFPHLEIACMVRGNPIHNDVTMEDADSVGLTEECRVISSGDGIAGTEIERISTQARRAIEAADVILSKGQGNFETLLGCGFNVYYLFLNKCDWYMQFFRTERFHGMFINDRRTNMTKYLKDMPC